MYMKQEDFQNLLISWQNPRKFLEHVWVSDPEHFSLTKFQLWPAAVDLWQTYLKHRFVMVLKPRQIGISWTFASIYAWKMVTVPMSRTLLISKGEAEARELLSHIRFIWKNLLTGTPFEGKQPGWELNPDSAGTIGIQWDVDKEIQSDVIALPCTATSGTGYTATDVFCDEWDKWPQAAGDLSLQEQAYSSLKPTVDRTRGHLCGCSTSELLNPGSFFKYLWHKEDSGFEKRFYPVTKHPLYTPEWFENICKEYAGKDHLRRQDYPMTEEEALTPPGEERIFPGADLLFDEAKNHTFRQEKPWVHVLYPFVSGWRYVAGADVASGHGSDYSVLSIIGTKGLSSEVVAVIRSKTLTTSEFAREIYQLCEKYNFPLLAIERNAMGVSVVDELVAMKYPRLFFKDDNAKESNKPGVTTGQAARQRGPNETGETWIWRLAQAINAGTLKTYFPPQIQELRDFYWIDNKAQARKGMNDDTVMSLAISNLLVGKAVGGSAIVQRRGMVLAPTLQRT